jgi:hypothetical protein
MMASMKIDAALARLKGVFLEIPGGMLDLRHACQLTGLDGETCLALLLALEQARFLRRSRCGDFSLRADWVGPEA